MKKAVLSVFLTSELIRRYNEQTQQRLVWRSLTVLCQDGCIRRVVASIKIRSIEYVTFLTFLPKTVLVDSLPAINDKRCQLQIFGKLTTVTAERWQDIIADGTFYDLGFNSDDKRFELLTKILID